MYRPTVRYDDVYKEYVDQVFRSTTLDRNQIIRAALFTAAHSTEFHKLLEPYKRKDVPTPSPIWDRNDHALWLEQCPSNREEGRDVNDGQHEVSTGEQIQKEQRKQQLVQGERRTGEVRKENGTLKITFK